MATAILPAGEYLNPETYDPLAPGESIVHAAWDRESRNGRLLLPVVYRDPKGRIWKVPAGFIFNGLSVPRFFWRLTPPYAGRAREASVVHDYLCVIKPCNSTTAHWVFYWALRANGVGLWTAWTRWAAVRFFGPQWGGK